MEKKKEKKKRKNYTQEEDDKIKEGVKKHGTDWEEIAKWAKIDRTGTQIKDRYRRLKKLMEEINGNKKRKLSEEDKAPASPQLQSIGMVQQELSLAQLQIESLKKAFEDERERVKRKEQIILEKDDIIKKN